jgi:hypothetical protein
VIENLAGEIASRLRQLGYWIVMVPFAVLPGIYLGPIATRMHGIDVAWLVSLIVSGVFYHLASLSFSSESEQAAIAASERDLEGSIAPSAHEIAAPENPILDPRVPQGVATT